MMLPPQPRLSPHALSLTHTHTHTVRHTHTHTTVRVQAQFDYLQGNYPVVRDDAAQMCALQIQAEHASTLLDDVEGLQVCCEKYVTKQVRLC